MSRGRLTEEQRAQLRIGLLTLLAAVHTAAPQRRGQSRLFLTPNQIAPLTSALLLRPVSMNSVATMLVALARHGLIEKGEEVYSDRAWRITPRGLRCVEMGQVGFEEWNLIPRRDT